MKARYDDITAKAGEPLWWDEHGTPRYAPFEPALCADPNAQQAAHLKVACVICRRDCSVAVSSSNLDLDIQTDLAARGEMVYGLLPHFEHCGRANRGDLLGVHSIWRKTSPIYWKRVL